MMPHDEFATTLLRTCKRSRLGLLLALTMLPGCITNHMVGTMAEPPLAPLAFAPSSVSAPVSLGLPECLHLALQQQPRVAAARVKLATAQEASRALATLWVPTILTPELPIRRQQAGLGVTAAAAGLDQAEREAVYAVTRTWFTVLFAREQERVAKSVVQRLSVTHKTAQEMVKGEGRDVSERDVNRSVVFLRLAQTRQVEAEEGVERALAALKEAIGLAPGARLEATGDRLPKPERRPSRDEVLALALARRGELIQAGVFVQVVHLEVEAQATSCLPRMQTFAAGSDIHGSQVPQGTSNSEYRPGAVPPEMPGMLAGSQAERMQQARLLQGRSETVLATTRNLISLEAEDAFLRWRQAERQAEKAEEATVAGEKLAEELSKDFTAGQKVKVEDMVNVSVVAAQAQSQWNEFRYKQILALADLERITAGGFCAGLTEATAPQPAPKEKAKSEKESDKGLFGPEEKNKAPKGPTPEAK